MHEAASLVRTILGFDYGTKKIGVAVGQTLTGTATPLMTLRAVTNRPDWEGVSTLIETWRPAALVVGIPYNMDDTENDMTRAARRFCRQLEGRYCLPTHTVDERLTTMEARAMLRESATPSSSGCPSGDVDKLAAQIILESWLAQQDHATGP